MAMASLQSHDYAYQSNDRTKQPQHYHECSSSDYDQAEAWCRKTISSGHEMMFSLTSFHEDIGMASKQFGLSFEALHSLFRNAHVTHMKRNSHSIRSQTMRHVKSYLNGSSILSLARKCNYPPSMMARLIVENVVVGISQSSNLSTANNAAGIANKSIGVAADGGVTGNNEHSSNHNNIPPAKVNTKANTKTNKNRAATTNDNNISKKKFITEALRHPEKILGCASTSILPQYQFSEKKNMNRGGKEQQLLDNFSGKPMYAVTGNNNSGDGNGNGNCSPSVSRLALEVREAIDLDPMYGPRQDRERHNVGIEYELLLEQTLQSMDIPFETEAELRVRGTAKTPDVLLSCPLGIRVRRKDTQNPLYLHNSNEEGMPTTFQQRARNLNLEDDDEYEWKIICWIDSKALFGDVETHTNSVLPQVETYVHRFGPGLVLYWFGHAPLSRLNDGHGDVVIAGGNLPDMLLMPTGELHGRGGQI